MKTYEHFCFWCQQHKRTPTPIYDIDLECATCTPKRASNRGHIRNEGRRKHDQFQGARR